MKNVFILFLMVSFVVSGCVSYDHYYKLDDQYLARRQLETRQYNTNDEETLLIASAQVLQDLGFTIDESEINLGLITANKDREAGSTGQMIGVIFLAALTGTAPIYDTNPKIYVTLVSTKNHNNGYNIRAEFARVIWNSMNQARTEKIHDEKIYNDFFDKLSSSVFLTANNI